MKFIKKTIILLVSLVCILLLIALFLPKDFSVERSVDIQATNAEVFDYLRFLKNQNEFGPWQNRDPRMKQSFEGIDGEVGALVKWSSKNEEVGTGEQEITRIDPEKRIEFALRFQEPYDSEALAYFTTEAKGSQSTTVKWGIKGESPWPFNIFLLFMDMDQEMGPDLEKGLSNLKKEFESY